MASTRDVVVDLKIQTAGAKKSLDDIKKATDQAIIKPAADVKRVTKEVDKVRQDAWDKEFKRLQEEAKARQAAGQATKSGAEETAKLGESFKKLGAAANPAAGAINSVGGALAGGTLSAQSAAGAFTSVAGSFGPWGAAIAGVVSGIVALISGMESASEKAKRMREDLDAVRETQSGVTDAQKSLHEALDQPIPNIDAATQAINGHLKEMEAISPVVAKSVEALLNVPGGATVENLKAASDLVDRIAAKGAQDEIISTGAALEAESAVFKDTFTDALESSITWGGQMEEAQKALAAINAGTEVSLKGGRQASAALNAQLNERVDLIAKQHEGDLASVDLEKEKLRVIAEQAVAITGVTAQTLAMGEAGLGASVEDQNKALAETTALLKEQVDAHFQVLEATKATAEATEAGIPAEAALSGAVDSRAKTLETLGVKGESNAKAQIAALKAEQVQGQLLIEQLKAKLSLSDAELLQEQAIISALAQKGSVIEANNALTKDGVSIAAGGQGTGAKAVAAPVATGGDIRAQIQETIAALEDQNTAIGDQIDSLEAQTVQGKAKIAAEKDAVDAQKKGIAEREKAEKDLIKKKEDMEKKAADDKRKRDEDVRKSQDDDRKRREGEQKKRAEEDSKAQADQRRKLYDMQVAALQSLKDGVRDSVKAAIDAARQAVGNSVSATQSRREEINSRIGDLNTQRAAAQANRSSGDFNVRQAANAAVVSINEQMEKLVAERDALTAFERTSGQVNESVAKDLQATAAQFAKARESLGQYHSLLEQARAGSLGEEGVKAIAELKGELAALAKTINLDTAPSLAGLTESQKFQMAAAGQSTYQTAQLADALRDLMAAANGLHGLDSSGLENYVTATDDIAEAQKRVAAVTDNTEKSNRRLAQSIKDAQAALLEKGQGLTDPKAIRELSDEWARLDGILKDLESLAPGGAEGKESLIDQIFGEKPEEKIQNIASALVSATDMITNFGKAFDEADTAEDKVIAGADLAQQVGAVLLKAPVLPLRIAGAVLVGGALITKAVAGIVKMFNHEQDVVALAEGRAAIETEILETYRKQQDAMEILARLGNEAVDSAQEQLDNAKALHKEWLANSAAAREIAHYTDEQLAAEKARLEIAKLQNDELERSAEAVLDQGRKARREWLEAHGYEVNAFTDTKKLIKEIIESTKAGGIAMDPVLEALSEEVDYREEALNLARHLKDVEAGRLDIQERLALRANDYYHALGRANKAFAATRADLNKGISGDLGVDVGSMDSEELAQYIRGLSRKAFAMLSDETQGLIDKWLTGWEQLGDAALDDAENLIQMRRDAGVIDQEEAKKQLMDLYTAELARLISINASEEERLAIQIKINELTKEENAELDKTNSALAKLVDKRQKQFLSGASVEATNRAIADELRKQGFDEDYINAFLASLPHYAEGGPTGAGGLAMTHPDEFVVKADAAKYYGEGFMRRLNALEIPKSPSPSMMALGEQLMQRNAVQNIQITTHNTFNNPSGPKEAYNGAMQSLEKSIEQVVRRKLGDRTINPRVGGL